MGFCRAGPPMTQSGNKKRASALPPQRSLRLYTLLWERRSPATLPHSGERQTAPSTGAHKRKHSGGNDCESKRVYQGIAGGDGHGSGKRRHERLLAVFLSGTGTD